MLPAQKAAAQETAWQPSAPSQRVAAEEKGSADTLAATLRARLRQGRVAVEEGQAREALLPLRAVFAQVPSFCAACSEEGSAAYWLGRARAAQGRTQDALDVWHEGVQAALARREVDVPSVDAYVRAVFASKDTARYERAAGLYVMLLEYGDAALQGMRAARVQQHVSELAFLLPGRLRQEALRKERGAYEINRDQDGGHELAAWWRSQDPLPATPKNERVIEHLERVAHARQAFGRGGGGGAAPGFDERGEVYVRLGAPFKKKELRYDSREMLDKIRSIKRAMGNPLQVASSDFAESTFWLYRGSGAEEDYYYLFVDRGRGYEIGEVVDLIPARLRGGDRSSGRGGAKTDVVLEALRAVYQQLARYHPDFGTRYARVDGYLAQIEEQRTAHRARVGDELYTRDKRSDNSALVRQNGSAAPGAQMHPGSFVRSVLQEARRKDGVSAYRRRERAPVQASRVLEDLRALPGAARAARFLEKDGTTTTKVYWGLRPGAPEEPEEEDAGAARAQQRYLRLSARQSGPRYRRHTYAWEQYRLPGRPGSEQIFTAPAPLVVTGDTALHHLHVQWEEFTMPAGQPRVLRIGVARFDSLAALDSSQARLEMSDLVPRTAEDEAALAQLGEDAGGGGNAAGLPGQAYPFSALAPGTPLALYFEAYHLALGPEGRARYTVEYEVFRKTEQGGLKRLFGEEQQQRTTTAVTYEGARRSAEEYILLDLDALPKGRGGRVAVTVRVTDEVSGQTVERTIDFDLTG